MLLRKLIAFFKNKQTSHIIQALAMKSVVERKFDDQSQYLNQIICQKKYTQISKIYSNAKQYHF